jgi:general secretion pathway protein C
MTTIAQQLPGIMQRNSIWLPRMLSYLLVILIAMSCAKLVWSLFSSDSASDAISEVKMTPPKLVKPPPPKPDYGSQIARLHLMGKASIANNPAISDQDAPDTSLNLILSGVLALGNGEGFAIIQDSTKKHKYYHIDDEVSSGVTLHSVFSNYVLLARSGRTEKLSLPKASEKGVSKVNSSTPRTTRSISNKIKNKPQVAVSQQEPSLSNLKQQLTKNPSSLAKYISISSANDEETGKFIGYKVKPNGSSSALFDELGLVEGDVITTINEISLDNPNKATQAFQKLVSASQLEMTILRSGTEINLVHNLE